MTKILITGSTGFVGKSLVPALVEAGYDLRCLVSQKQEWIHTEQIVIGRIEEQQDWSVILEGVDVVIHLAARVHLMKDTATSPLDEYLKVNCEATKNLAKQAAQHKVKRFIFLSSIKVNGEATQPQKPFTEEQMPQPEDPYGISKWEAEKALMEIAQTTPMEVVVLRPPLIYGPGVKANFLKMIKLVEKGFPMPFGKVSNRRSFLYIENLVSAIIAVIESPKAANQTFLVSDDEPLSLSALLKGLSVGLEVNVQLIPLPSSLLRLIFIILGRRNLSSRLLDSLEISQQKMKNQLGWKPPIKGMDGLMKTSKWYRDVYKC